MRSQSPPVNLQRVSELQRRGRLDEARAACRRLVEARPADPRPYRLLATIEGQSGNLDAAAAALENACRLNPEDSATWKEYGFLLHSLDDETAALGAYRRTVALAPDDAAAWCEIGALLQRRGERDQSIAAHQRAFRLSGVAKSALALSGLDSEFGRPRAERRRLEEALEGEADPLSKEYLSFALCRIHERLGHHETAFRYARQGQEIRRRRGDFRIEARIRSARTLIPHFGPDLLGRHGATGDSSEQPVFVVGMPRTGTTLVEQIVASHPEAAGIGEFNGLAQSVMAVMKADRGPDDVTERLRAADWGEVARDYLRGAQTRAGGTPRRIVDKNPFNFALLGFVALMFPGARVLHCERDRLDTLWSCFSTCFAQSHLSFTLAELGRLYGLEKACMGYWKTAFPVRLHTVGHERLVEDFETEAQALIRFLGLEWRDECAEFHRTGRVVRTASSAQVTQGLYRHHLGRGRPFEPWLGAAVEAMEQTRAGLERDWARHRGSSSAPPGSRN